MAVLKNILETSFKATGLSNLTKARKETNEYAEAVENVGQQSVRASNASAAAGRRFASQARGLGGFVGIYAGAAASIFAISQAFETLSRAARVETTIAGTRALARAVGTSATEVLDSIKKITGGQLSLAQSAEIANVALSAGFSGAQLEGLTEVAVKASRALGRDLTDSYNRLIRGVAKLEPELLDELGIFTKLGIATEKYAAELGVSVSSLTEFQRRQAFANAALEEGNRKFKLVQVSTTSTQASLERLAASFSDLTTKATQTLGNVLVPLLDTISGNVGTLYTVLLALGTIVFRNLAKELAFAGVGLSEYLSRLESNTNKVTETFKQLSAEAEGGLSIYQKIQKEGGGSFVSLDKTKDRQTAIGVFARASIEPQSFGQMKKDIKVLEELIVAEQKYQELQYKRIDTEADAEILFDQSDVRQKEATRLLEIYTEQTKKATLTQRVFGRSAIVVSKAISILNGALSATFKLLSGIGLVVGVGQIIASFFGVDIIGEVVEAIGKLTRSSKELKAGIEGIAVAAINARKVDIKSLFPGIEPKEITKDIQDVLSEFRKGRGAIPLFESTQGKGRFAEVTNIYSKETLVLFDETIKKLGLTREEIKSGSKELIGFANNIVTIADKVIELNNLKTLTPEQQRELFVLKAVLEEISKVSFGEAIGQLNTLTGIPTDELVGFFAKLQEESGGFGKQLKLNGVIIADFVDGQYSLIQGLKFLTAATAQYEDASTRLNDGLKEGNLSAENASQQLEAVRTTLKRLTQETDKFEIVPEGLSNAIQVANNELEEQSKLVFRIIEAENDLAFVRKQYSKELQAFSNARAEGIIDANGKIAKSEKEIQLNRLSNLQEIVKRGDEAAKQLQTSIITTEARSSLEAELKAGVEAFKAAIGGSRLLLQETTKLTKDLQDRNRLLTYEYTLLVLQNRAASARATIEAETTRQQVEQNKIQANIKVFEARVSLVKQEADGIKQLFDLAKKRIEAERDLSDQISRRVSAEESLASTRRQISIARTIRGLRRQEQEQELFSGLFSGAQQSALQRSIAREEYKLNLEILDQKQRQAEREYQNNLEIIDRKIKDTLAEQANQEAIQANRERQYVIEDRITNERNRLEILGLENQQKINRLRSSEIEAQKNLQIAQVQIDRDNKLQELQQVQDQYDILRDTALTYKNILTAEETLLNKRAEIAGVEKVSILDSIKELDSIVSSLEPGGEIEKQLESARSKINLLADEAVRGIEESLGTQQSNLIEANTGIDEVISKTKEVQSLTAETERLKREGERREQREAKETSNIRIQSLEEEQQALRTNFIESQILREDERKAAEDEYKNRVREIEAQEEKAKILGSTVSSLIEDKIGQGFEDLFDAIAAGTLTLQNFKTGVLSLFKSLLTDIAKEFLRQSVVKPISSGLGSLIGTGLSALLGGAGSLLSDSALAEAVGSGATATGTLATPALSLVGNIGGLMNSVGAIQRFAEGGEVQLRDSVPALLEPGEFVIRKPIVNAVGARNLEQLNATGKMGGASNIKVEVQNSGAPKEAQQGPVSFDGEKAVVKIILSDLKNNGPIRKTLRGTM